MNPLTQVIAIANALTDAALKPPTQAEIEAHQKRAQARADYNKFVQTHSKDSRQQKRRRLFLASFHDMPTQTDHGIVKRKSRRQMARVKASRVWRAQQ